MSISHEYAGSAVSAPVATVVVTTHNRHELADRALASALAQTLENIEVIIVDDGSSAPYRLPTSDSRLKLIRSDRSGGPSRARNLAITEATGQWIAFLDDDDTLTPEMLEVSIKAAEESNLPEPVSVLSAAEVVTPEGEVLRTRVPPSLPKGKHFFLEDVEGGGSFQTHATLVAPVEVVRSIGAWDEDLRASEHDDFFLRLNQASSIQGVETVTYRITAHEGPRLSKAVLTRAEGMRRTVEKHEKTFSLHPRRYSHYLSTMGLTYLRAGQWRSAVSATSRSVRVDPTNAEAYKRALASIAGPWSVRVARRLRGNR